MICHLWIGKTNILKGEWNETAGRHVLTALVSYIISENKQISPTPKMMRTILGGTSGGITIIHL